MVGSVNIDQKDRFRERQREQKRGKERERAVLCVSEYNGGSHLKVFLELGAQNLWKKPVERFSVFIKVEYWNPSKFFF